MAGKSTQAGLLKRYLSENGEPACFMEMNDQFAIQVMNGVARSSGLGSGRSLFGNDLYDFAKYFDLARDSFQYVNPLLVLGMHVIVPRSMYCSIARSLALGTTILWAPRKIGPGHRLANQIR